MKKYDQIVTANFRAAIGECDCDCHRGQWAVILFAVSPDGKEKIPVGDKKFSTRDEALKNLEPAAIEMMDKCLENVGIKKDDVISQTSKPYNKDLDPGLH